jgi:hypothetical protein
MSPPAKTKAMSADWFIVVLVASLVLPFTVVLATNLARDPFQLFHAGPRGNEAVFLGGGGTSRYQNAGVIRYHQPRSIVLGHSLAANFLPTQVERLLGWRDTHSLTLNGSTIYEHGRIARFAAKHTDVEQVLWLISPMNLRLGASITNRHMDFPAYLYDDSRLNDLAFFATLPANLAPYMQRKKVLEEKLDRMHRRKQQADPRDYANAWHFLEPGRFNVPKRVRDVIIGKGRDARGAFNKAVAEAAAALGPEDIAQLAITADDNFHANFRQNLYEVIADHPMIEFSLVIMPPLPRLYWQQMRSMDPGFYFHILAYIREAVTQLDALDNVRVYAFARESYADDLRLYKDSIHYHIAVNDDMLQSIAAGKEPLTATKVADYLSDFDRDISRYRLPDSWPATQAQGKALDLGKLDRQEAENIIRYYRDKTLPATSTDREAVR